MVMARLRQALVYVTDGKKAGYGFISDGVPERIGCGLDHDSSMPPPIGTRVRLCDEPTKRMRKATV